MNKRPFLEHAKLRSLCQLDLLVAGRALAAVVMLGAAATTFAQSPRPLPPDSKLARMTYSGDMTVIVDGYAAALTMGAQIRNEQNLIIVPSALPNLSLVRYTADDDGRINRVWVVRADEVEMPVQTTGKLQRQ